MTVWDHILGGYVDKAIEYHSGQMADPKSSFFDRLQEKEHATPFIRYIYHFSSSHRMEGIADPPPHPFKPVDLRSTPKASVGGGGKPRQV